LTDLILTVSTSGRGGVAANLAAWLGGDAPGCMRPMTKIIELWLLAAVVDRFYGFRGPI
jgi:hypothetical protein